MDASAPPCGLPQTRKAGKVEPVDGKVPSGVTVYLQVYIKIFSHQTEGEKSSLLEYENITRAPHVLHYKLQDCEELYLTYYQIKWECYKKNHC